MYDSSHKLLIDHRLLAIEEQVRQRRMDAAHAELATLDESMFVDNEHERGLYLALKADDAFFQGNYRLAIDQGLAAAKILADSPLHRSFGRILLVLAKTYNALGDLKNCDVRAHDSLASYRRANDANGQIDALNELAGAAFIRSRLDAAASFLDDALALATDNPRKQAQLTGNLARIRILSGQWQQAEKDLQAALAYFSKVNEPISLTLNLLSIGYLCVRRRDFTTAERHFAQAGALIDKLGLKREKIICLEYLGELAFERGDLFKAKSIFTDAYTQGRMLAPSSALVSQSGRRLAEVELALDRVDEAMKYGQIALEVALQVGERSEVGLAKRVIARVFALRSQFDEALEYMYQAVELVRESGDPADLARTLLIQAEVKVAANSDEIDKIRTTYDEAGRLFKKLGLDYWIAETEFRSGMFACQHGDLSRGFRKLSRAEKVFAVLNETGKVRGVNQLLSTIAEQAVALSISETNEFKLLSNLVTQSEMKDVKSGQMDDVIALLTRRTGAARVVLYSPDIADTQLVSSIPLDQPQQRRFLEGLQRMVGQEISTTRPTLLLDCRRDPYINELFPHLPDVIASVIVVPVKMSDDTTSFLYLDKLSIDNMLNPFSQTELNFAVGFSDIIAFKAAEMQKQKLLEDNRRLRAQLREQTAFPNIITQNGQMRELLAQLRQVVDSSISITIEGETGSGKDLLAQAIHYNSRRRDKRFISVNCAALPETLLESELFGYRKGTFTGADRDKPGLFEEADGGTFFLDEIADMPLAIQAKILRVLEAKEIVRLGESVPRKVDVRVLSATNKDLKEEMAAGRFRQDLYYRLSALPFRLPPLRERREDIPLLVNHFLEESGKRVSSDVMRSLISYDWPGNIRELENEVKKIILLAGDSQQVELDVLSSKISGNKTFVDLPSITPAATLDHDPNFDGIYSLYDFLAEHEKRFILRALKDRGGVKKHAAALLNIPESTLRLKIKQYNIDLDHLDRDTVN